jgi:hypothetical protein
MVDPQHPLTPPKQLINAWRAEGYHQDYFEVDDYLYHKIAEWGWQQRNATVPQELQESADQELDACCEWFRVASYGLEEYASDKLRAARRPKPPVSAEEALRSLDEMDRPLGEVTSSRCSAIREALERLQELEAKLR